MIEPLPTFPMPPLALDIHNAPWPGMLTWPAHPAVAIVYDHNRGVPCCQAHLRGRVKWLNAVGFKPRVELPHHAAACEGCKAEEYHRIHNPETTEEQT